MKLHANTLPPHAPSPHTIRVLTETIQKNKNLSFIDRHFLQLVHTAMGTKTALWELCQPLHGLSWRNHLGSLHLGSSYLEEIHRWHLPDLPRHHHTTAIHEGFNEQPPPHDQIHFWTLQPRDFFFRHEDPFRNRPQTLNNPVQKTHWLCCTSAPTTHLNAKKALFSQRLLDIISSLQMTTCYKKN